MYVVGYYLIVYNFADHCHRVETRLQLINIISYIMNCEFHCPCNLASLPKAKVHVGEMNIIVYDRYQIAREAFNNLLLPRLGTLCRHKA
jgi:hypothetical protein